MKKSKWLPMLLSSTEARRCFLYGMFAGFLALFLLAGTLLIAAERGRSRWRSVVHHWTEVQGLDEDRVGPTLGWKDCWRRNESSWFGFKETRYVGGALSGAVNEGGENRNTWPAVWIAPDHSFYRTTVEVVVCDGQPGDDSELIGLVEPTFAAIGVSVRSQSGGEALPIGLGINSRGLLCCSPIVAAATEK